MKFWQRLLCCFYLFGAPLGAQEILVKPYLQPGDGTALKEDDVKIVSWITSEPAAEFKVEYGPSPNFGHIVQADSILLKVSGRQPLRLYRATLPHLPWNTPIGYRVKQADRVVRQSTFQTRSKGNRPIQFTVTGDTGNGSVSARKIAYQMWKQRPEFGIIVGDIVYPSGRVGEYLDHYVEYYINTDKAGPESGAPILASAPFYFVLGNHDIHSSNLRKTPDGLAAFYFWSPPLNGPTSPSFGPPIRGDLDRIAAFREAAGRTYPGLANYSFDNGPAHFLILDANEYSDVANPVWRRWIEEDLTTSHALWKIVLFHQPGFHSSKGHYEEQHMRTFAPLFERCGVDLVINGHVHNYQRSKPLKFQPEEDWEKIFLGQRLSQRKRIDGRFKIDNHFDGLSQTTPQGIIYLVSGGGGAELYDPELTDRPSEWKHDSKNWAPFTAKFISDRHSFTHITLDENTLSWRQIDEDGNEIDRCTMTKGVRGN